MVVDDPRRSRRSLMCGGVKLAFAAPVLSTFFAAQAYATNYSCYAESVDKDCSSSEEPCCPDLSCQDIGGGTFRCRP